MLKRVLLALLAAVILQTPLSAKLEIAQKEIESVEVAKMETYFAAINTLESDFVQLNADGTLYRGKFYMNRPGKFRLDYSDPNDLLVISDGKYLMNYEGFGGDATHIPLDSTPAYFLAREKISFTGDVTVTQVLHSIGEVSMTVVRTADPGAGSITFVFTGKPFTLKKWIVKDAEGSYTHVELSNILLNQPLDKKLFLPQKKYL